MSACSSLTAICLYRGTAATSERYMRLHSCLSADFLLTDCHSTVDRHASLICIRTHHQLHQCCHALMASSNSGCWFAGLLLTAVHLWLKCANIERTIISSVLSS